MKERLAIFAKTDEERYDAAAAWLQRHRPSAALYVCPANRIEEVRRRLGCLVIAFEDVTKTAHILPLHEQLTDDTAIILDGAIRYNKVTSSKFKPLHGICRGKRLRLVLDVAPFYASIRSLYFLFSYLDRAILGYQHWYAFRPNNMEEAINGEPVPAHDPDLLAFKIAPHSDQRYRRLLADRRRFVECATTAEEETRYAERKAELFATRKTPQPIITRLADTAHAFGSRMAAFLDLVSGLDGRVLALTNLQSYAKRAAREAAEAGRPLTVRSYYDGCSDTGEFDHVVYLESPIVNSYLLLDFEARVRPDASVWHVIGDAKVDRFLSGRIRDELTVMDNFTDALWRAKHGASA